MSKCYWQEYWNAFKIELTTCSSVLTGKQWAKAPHKKFIPWKHINSDNKNYYSLDISYLLEGGNSYRLI